MNLEEVLTERAARAKPRTWLVIMPASGTPVRHHGALVYAEVGGETGWSVFIVYGVRAVAIDPRAIIYADDTLELAWHPRQHIHQTHKLVGEWFAKNPDVFSVSMKPRLLPL